MTVDTLIEGYSILKEYIPSKERQAAADHLMSSMADMLDEKDLFELGKADSYLKNSFREYAKDFEIDEEDDSDDYDYDED